MVWQTYPSLLYYGASFEAHPDKSSNVFRGRQQCRNTAIIWAGCIEKAGVSAETYWLCVRSSWYVRPLLQPALLVLVQQAKTQTSQHRPCTISNRYTFRYSRAIMKTKCRNLHPYFLTFFTTGSLWSNREPITQKDLDRAEQRLGHRFATGLCRIAQIPKRRFSTKASFKRFRIAPWYFPHFRHWRRTRN